VRDYIGSEKLHDKVALITRDGRGIGRAVAMLFAKEDADEAVGNFKEDKPRVEQRRLVEVQGRKCLLAGLERKGVG